MLSRGRGGGQVSVSRLTFGQRDHGARHLAGTGLSQGQVEAAIRRHVSDTVGSASSVGQSFWGRVTVQGTQIEYRAWNRGNRQFHVGTYYPVP